MNNKNLNFDIIVIGGGHAGVEAAFIASKMGCRILLITIYKNKIGHMPCNPAIGGIGKGHIVFEISSLGGLMPQVCEKTYLQANMLNRRKGPAVQGLRLQIDKKEYSKKIIEELECCKNISILEATVKNLIIKENNRKKYISGVVLEDNLVINCDSVIITTGTFLNGLLHMGLNNYSAGRINEKGVSELSNSIKNLNLQMGRLKTGTPARLLDSSIDFSVMEEQVSHDLNGLFCFNEHKVIHKKSCFITRTNETTHQIIKENAHLSPIYRGEIKGISPRYCPSIEDKIKRFADKDSHHIFVEPEGLLDNKFYPNGLSTSLPIEIQEKFLKSIKGFENIEILEPAYAIEYDFVLPNQLNHTLETKEIDGLFFAGQINGTTGYEEAAAQGLIAGINAASKKLKLQPFVLNREESYIGTMIDDLVTFGVDEPYRMFTSRAERRLILRQDNVFYRLYKKAFEYKLIDEFLYKKIEDEFNKSKEIINELIKKESDKILLFQQISNGNDDLVKEKIRSFSNINERQIEYIFAEILYFPYYEREMLEVKKLKEYRDLKIPSNFIFKNIPGLSIELQQKLEKYKPETIAQASLIQGMTPAALSLLIFKTR
jgi:tRNA uridine 5-carboxymethylaminomethyl modification enzyme